MLLKDLERALSYLSTNYNFNPSSTDITIKGNEHTIDEYVCLTYFDEEEDTQIKLTHRIKPHYE